MANVKYDYLIVGSGLFGSVFAYEANKAGKKCLVIDRRSHSGGNVHCQNLEGINVHSYGAHIFHTDSLQIWNYINQFADFNHYINSPLALSEGNLYNLPFNMNTFYQLWGVKTPAEARSIIEAEVNSSNFKNPANLEEQALSLVGESIYKKFIQHYTKKQWGRDASCLPAFIIKRLPLRYTYNNNYFNDRYQGIPIGGYNLVVNKMLQNIELRLSHDFFKDRSFFESLAEKIVFTGKIDEFYQYQYGKLEYRSLKFEHEIHDIHDYQGNAVVNYCDLTAAFTRIIEHKHFEFGSQKSTVITKEYAINESLNNEPYYPINDTKNMKILKRYQCLADKESNVIFGGRLAEYRYYDMHQVIASALKKASDEQWK